MFASRAASPYPRDGMLLYVNRMVRNAGTGLFGPGDR
jgi:hypothetical protein